MTMQAFFYPDGNAILLITCSVGIFLSIYRGALRSPVWVHNKNPHTAGNQKNGIAIKLKERLHGHQVKRPFSEKSFNLMFK